MTDNDVKRILRKQYHSKIYGVNGEWGVYNEVYAWDIMSMNIYNA